MKLPRRQFLHLVAAAAALPVVSRIARAQPYPARPVHIIVGFAPAGGNDIMKMLSFIRKQDSHKADDNRRDEAQCDLACVRHFPLLPIADDAPASRCMADLVLAHGLPGPCISPDNRAAPGRCSSAVRRSLGGCNGKSNP